MIKSLDKHAAVSNTDLTMLVPIMAAEELELQ